MPPQMTSTQKSLRVLRAAARLSSRHATNRRRRSALGQHATSPPQNPRKYRHRAFLQAFTGS
jgi:hypothetical protein